MLEEEIKTLNERIDTITDAIKDTNDVLHKIVGPVLKDDKDMCYIQAEGTIKILYDKLCVLLRHVNDSTIMAKHLDDWLD